MPTSRHRYPGSELDRLQIGRPRDLKSHREAFRSIDNPISVKLVAGQLFVPKDEAHRMTDHCSTQYLSSTLETIRDWEQHFPESPLGAPVLISKAAEDRITDAYGKYCIENPNRRPLLSGLPKSLALHIQRHLLACWWKEEQDRGAPKPFPLGILYAIDSTPVPQRSPSFPSMKSSCKWPLPSSARPKPPPPMMTSLLGRRPPNHSLRASTSTISQLSATASSPPITGATTSLASDTTSPAPLPPSSPSTGQTGAVSVAPSSDARADSSSKPSPITRDPRIRKNGHHHEQDAAGTDSQHDPVATLSAPVMVKPSPPSKTIAPSFFQVAVRDASNHPTAPTTQPVGEITASSSLTVIPVATSGSVEAGDSAQATDQPPRQEAVYSRMPAPVIPMPAQPPRSTVSDAGCQTLTFDNGDNKPTLKRKREDEDEEVVALDTSGAITLAEILYEFSAVENTEARQTAKAFIQPRFEDVQQQHSEGAAEPVGLYETGILLTCIESDEARFRNVGRSMLERHGILRHARPTAEVGLVNELLFQFLNVADVHARQVAHSYDGRKVVGYATGRSEDMVPLHSLLRRCILSEEVAVRELGRCMYQEHRQHGMV